MSERHVGCVEAGGGGARGPKPRRRALHGRARRVAGRRCARSGPRLGLTACVMLSALLALWACSGATRANERGQEDVNVDTVVRQAGNGGGWQALPGAVVRGRFDARVTVDTVDGSVGQILVRVAGVGPVARFAERPYAFVLDTRTWEVGSYRLVVEVSEGRGDPPQVVEEMPFDVGETEPKQVAADDQAWSGPLVITEGGTYSGRWESTSTGTPAVTIETSEPVVIENSRLRGPDHLVVAHWQDAHVTIRNVAGEGLYPTERGAYPGRFLHAEGYRGVVVENSYMEGTSGIYLNDSEVGATVRIVGNRADDIDGRRSDGNGGYDGHHLVQFVQLNRGNGLRDSEIAWNAVVNRPYESRVEDVVNLHKAGGASSSDPIRIHHNYIDGAYPADPARDSFSGGGILVGDDGGGHVHVYENHVVATTNYGVAIAGGYENRLYDNTVVSCGVLPDGTEIAAQNVGAYIGHVTGNSFRDNTGWGNEVAWAHPDHDRNDWWVPDAAEWSDNVRLVEGQSVSCALQEDVYAAWLEETQQVNVTVGLLGPG